MAQFKNFEKGFSITWKIEKFSLLPHQKNEKLESPTFVVENLNKTEWKLNFYPKGNNRDNCISLFLRRADFYKNKTASRISFTFAIESVDGAIENVKVSENIHINHNSPSWGYPLYLSPDILFDSKNKYLPHDVLTIKCHIWPSQEKRKASVLTMESATLDNYFEKGCSALTTIKVDKSTLMWPITKIRELCESQEKIYIDLDNSYVRSPSLKLSFYINKDSNDEFAQIDILQSKSPFADISNFVKCRMTVVTDRKEHQTSYEDSHWFSSNLDEVWHFPEFILIDGLIDGKYAHLGDTMFLYCEFTFPQKDSEHHLDLPFRVPNTSQGSSELGKFFENKKFCDVEVRCGEQTFPCHKLVLCAKSPVFTAMFENDMKEKKTGVIEVPDFDPPTVKKMLEFLYKAVIEDELSTEEICNLYSIADKYEVLPLQQCCSNLLLSNLSVANVCSVLVTADSHRHDNFLWVHVNNFLNTNTRAIFHSPQWKAFMNDNPTLSTETMIRMCTK